MKEKSIIVIGASAGGFQPLKTIVGGLSRDINAAVFIVWHMAPDVRGVLPQVLNRYDTLYAAHALDQEPIEVGRIYVAPPDRHLLIDNDRVRLTRGPKEHLFRPAIDPLFRSAAYHHDHRVIGIVLSGALDDGTAGLWTIKQRGGTAVVQSPDDAEVPSMPENAIREVSVDHIVPASEISEVLNRLVKDQTGDGDAVKIDEMEHVRTRHEVRISAEDDALERGVFDLGELSPYTCPKCHGVLTAIRDGRILRFRCHTGHAFSADSLLASLTQHIEDSFWNAVRALDESIILLDHMGDHFAERNDTKVSALYFKKANEAKKRKELIREAIMSHELLSNDTVRQAALDKAEAAEPPPPEAGFLHHESQAF